MVSQPPPEVSRESMCEGALERFWVQDRREPDAPDVGQLLERDRRVQGLLAGIDYAQLCDRDRLDPTPDARPTLTETGGDDIDDLIDLCAVGQEELS